MRDFTKDKFIAIMKNGGIVEKDKLSKIVCIPGAEYYLRAKYDNTFVGPSNTTHCYQFGFINELGEPLILKIGDFEVNYIDVDNGLTNFFGRAIYICDRRKDRLYSFKSMVRGAAFVKNELIPLLNELNDYGSWEARECYLENEKLKKEITYLKEKISRLEKED